MHANEFGFFRNIGFARQCGCDIGEWAYTDECHRLLGRHNRFTKHANAVVDDCSGIPPEVVFSKPFVMSMGVVVQWYTYANRNVAKAQCLEHFRG